MRPPLNPDDIDAHLPQTQCGLCGYGGCMPYAEALAFEDAPINLCPPGGVDTLMTLGQLLAEDPAPYVAEMQAKTEARVLAQVREEECIGCTKCIQACPVDAIVGAAKHMHTVITDACTGCKLCVPPCPVDCIDLLPTNTRSTEEEQAARQLARQRFAAHTKRAQAEKKARAVVKQRQSAAERQAYIAQARARVQAKKPVGSR